MRSPAPLLTHLIGRPLTALNFNQQRYEADFRFNLVRVRENSEQIALLHGETGRTGAPASSASARWSRTGSRIMTRTKQLTFLTAELQPGLHRVSAHRGQPGLFRRPVSSSAA